MANQKHRQLIGRRQALAKLGLVASIAYVTPIALQISSAHASGSGGGGAGGSSSGGAGGSSSSSGSGGSSSSGGAGGSSSNDPIVNFSGTPQ